MVFATLPVERSTTTVPPANPQQTALVEAVDEHSIVPITFTASTPAQWRRLQGVFAEHIVSDCCVVLLDSSLQTIVSIYWRFEVVLLARLTVNNMILLCRFAYTFLVCE